MLVVLLPIAAAALGTTLYKWVDDKGVTHYSETPPAKQKAQEIRIQPPPSGAGDSRPPQAPPTPGAEAGTAAPPKTWQEKALEAQLRREAAEKKEEAEQVRVQELARRRKERCVWARQNLHTLQTDRPVYQINEYGERAYIDDAKRAAEIERMKQEIQANCDPKPQ